MIERLRLPVRLGCTAEERAYPQIVDVDIAIELKEAKSATTDSLADTVDYMVVVQSTKEISSSKEFYLLEHLAAEIGRAIVKSETYVHSTSVKVTKQIVPQCAGIAVRLSVDATGKVIQR